MIILRKINVYKEVDSEDEAAALEAKGFERVKAETEPKAEVKVAPEIEDGEKIEDETESLEKEEDDDGAKKATSKGKTSGKGK